MFFWFASLCILFSFAIILTRKKELVALLFKFVFPMLVTVALPQGAMDCSTMCDCDIS